MKSKISSYRKEKDPSYTSDVEEEAEEDKVVKVITKAAQAAADAKKPKTKTKKKSNRKTRWKKKSKKAATELKAVQINRRKAVNKKNNSNIVELA